ncbi:MarR family transcriptional regulator [Actinomadura sp. 7K507]|uniref:MarR family winged helix-turn-helix transcriptional regulator n=1 Tax=Actinomadura sp. 7K507 TaxID=2530365 RepID=UPI0026830D27
MGLARLDHLVLAALAADPGKPCPLNVLSRRVAAHPTTVAGTVGVLEHRGLVVRLPHSTDRRVTLVEITPAGSVRVGEADAVIEAAQPDLLRAVYDDHRHLLELLGPLLCTTRGAAPAAPPSPSATPLQAP